MVCFLRRLAVFGYLEAFTRKLGVILNIANMRSFVDASKQWMDLLRYSKEYSDGVEYFLNFAYSVREPEGEEIQCPCVICCNINWYRRNIVYDHLVCYGFVKGYRTWINHGEWTIPMEVDSDIDDENNSCDDIDGLLNGAFRNVAETECGYEGPNGNAKKFYNLIDEASQELYPGCKSFSTLSFTICLYLLKCLHGWSNASFTSLLELLKEAMPNLNIPLSFGKMKTMVKDLGLDYKKIDACPNDCILYRNEHKHDKHCHVCGASRYIETPEVDSEFEPPKKCHRLEAEIVETLCHRNFPTGRKFYHDFF